MTNRHEPRSEFIDQLEGQIGREVRRRNREASEQPVRGPLMLRTMWAACALIVVSMGIGAAATAATYQVQSNARGHELAMGIQQQLALAEQRVTLASDELRQTRQRVEAGLAARLDLLESQFKVTQAQNELRSLQLQLEEVKASGRDPGLSVSSPLVAGRDFVRERLRLDMTTPQLALDLERARLQNMETRVSVGAADPADLDASKVRVLELQLALETLQTKLEIRQKFLAGGFDAVEADLRVLEAEADQRCKTLMPRIDLAGKQVDRANAKARVGAGELIDVNMATLKRLELQTELAKAQLELSFVRKQIAQHKR